MKITKDQAKSYVKAFVDDGLREGSFSANAVKFFKKSFRRTKSVVKIEDNNESGQMTLNFDPEEIRILFENSANEKEAKSRFYEALDAEMQSIKPTSNSGDGEKHKFFMRIARKAFEKSGKPFSFRRGKKARQFQEPVSLGNKLRFFIANSKQGCFEAYVPRNSVRENGAGKTWGEFNNRKNLAVAIDSTGKINGNDVLSLFRAIKKALNGEIEVTVLECDDKVRKVYCFPSKKRMNQAERQEEGECPKISVNEGKEFNASKAIEAAEGFYDALIVLSEKPEKVEDGSIPVFFVTPKDLRNA